MSVYIHGIETAVPETYYPQEMARERMKTWVGSEKEKRIVHHVYRRSGIDGRHSVIRDFQEGETPRLFETDASGHLSEPSTEARNKLFTEESKVMSVDLARRIVEGAAGFHAMDVTHVVTASCTGFYNPGPDYHIVRELGLSHGTQRYHLGFMGCYAAFPALRMAEQFCRADPRAVVLVVCLELCSLHMQLNGDLDSLLANSLFADGAAAALVSARKPASGAPAFKMDGFSSSLVPRGEKDMAWDIGDKGFNIVLSSYVPEILGSDIREILEPVLATHDLSREEIDLWAVHPGGKAILTAVEKGLDLPSDCLAVSRDILRRYGNMSSATILFVLREMLMAPADPDRARVCAMAFGPGLTVEAAVLEHMGVCAPDAPRELAEAGA